MAGAEVEEKGGMEKYLQEMVKSGTWADHIVVAGVALGQKYTWCPAEVWTRSSAHHDNSLTRTQSR